MFQNLDKVIEQQRSLLANLEEMKSLDLGQENAKLQAELELAKSNLLELQEKVRELEATKVKLQDSLEQKLREERSTVIDYSMQKVNRFFVDGAGKEYNRLLSLEKKVMERTNHLENSIHGEIDQIVNGTLDQFRDICKVLSQEIEAAKNVATETKAEILEEAKEEYQALREEAIKSDMYPTIAAFSAKQPHPPRPQKPKKNWEKMIGLNIINKVGLVLIVLAAIVGSQYAYAQMNDIFRLVVIFGVATVMLLAGEFLSRRKANVFSIGLSAGGIAVSYVGLVMGYFIIAIFPMLLALALCLLVTALALWLSLRYDAEVILSFALFGGYLPVISLAQNNNLLVAAMVYFIILNLLALWIATRKKWVISSYIGLVLNIMASGYITSLIHGKRDLDSILSLSYVLIAFAIYTVIPIVSNVKQNLDFKARDIVLLGMNTFFSSVILIVSLYRFGFDSVVGIFVAVFAIVYLYLAYIMKDLFENYKKISGLFWVTGYTFLILVIPFQFDVAWLSLGWLVEAVLLYCYGVYRKDKKVEQIAYIIYTFCVLSFVSYSSIVNQDPLFSEKYFAITLGSIVMVLSYVVTKREFKESARVLRFVAYVNLWIYSLYVIFEIIGKQLVLEPLNAKYLLAGMGICISYLLAFYGRRIPFMRSKEANGFAVFLQLFGGFWLFVLNAGTLVVEGSLVKSEWQYIVIGTLLILILSFLTILMLYDAARTMTKSTATSIQGIILGISIYGIILLTQNLLVQYDLEFTNFLVSILYVVIAFVCILIGFSYRFIYMRRFGLALSIFAVVKLCLIDLGNMTQGYTMISYLVLGLILLAISFVYQYFSKRIEEQEEVE